MFLSVQRPARMEPMRDRWIRLVGMPLVTLLATFTFSASAWMDRPGFFWKSLFGTLFTVVPAWELCRVVLLRVRRRCPDLRHTARRVLFSWIGYALVNALVISAMFAFYVVTDYWQKPIGFPVWLKNFISAMTFTSLVASVYEAAYFFQQWQRERRYAQELKSQALQCQLDALKSQLSPHFLFNSLNVLSSLVDEDFERAERYVAELKHVYKYVLDVSGRPLVTLAEELAGLQAYFFLLRTRFGDHLQLEVELPDNRHTLRLPPLTLQMLLENAVKHNIVSAGKPLLVQIQSPRPDYLLVFNNLQPKNQLIPSSHVGLDNIRQRYSMLGRPMPQVWSTEGTFVVQTPLIDEWKKGDHPKSASHRRVQREKSVPLAPNVPAGPAAGARRAKRHKPSDSKYWTLELTQPLCIA